MAVRKRQARARSLCQPMASKTLGRLSWPMLISLWETFVSLSLNSNRRIFVLSHIVSLIFLLSEDMVAGFDGEDQIFLLPAPMGILVDTTAFYSVRVA